MKTRKGRGVRKVPWQTLEVRAVRQPIDNEAVLEAISKKDVNGG